jgi:peptidoglycan/LPS O-acetylase OafA/YrhL
MEHQNGSILEGQVLNTPVRDDERVVGFDLLRGVAIMAVFFFHMLIEFNTGQNGWLGQVYSHRLSFFLLHFGKFGVSLFLFCPDSAL